MKREELAITIGPDGQVAVKVQGVKGKSCLQTAKFLEDQLGTVEKRDFTSEYHEQEAGVVGWDKLRSGG